MSRDKDPNNATFRVGDIFPASADERVETLRFLMATRTLVCIGQINAWLDERPEFEEAKAYLMFLALGAAAEASKVFSKADRKGCFKDIEREKDPDLCSRLARLRAAAKAQPFREFVTYGRNKVSFHWDMREIRDALKAVADERIAAVIAYGDTGSFLDTRVPVAAATAVKVLQLKAGGQKELDELMSAVAQLQGDLFHIAQAALGYLLIQSRRLPDEQQSEKRRSTVLS